MRPIKLQLTPPLRPAASTRLDCSMSAPSIRCPRCSRAVPLSRASSPDARCDYCGDRLQKSTAETLAKQPAEKLFFPPGFKQSAEKAPVVEHDVATRVKGGAADDRMSPGFSRRPAGDATGDVEAPSAIELPPGVDSPPPIPPSVAASLVGPPHIASTSPAAVAGEIDDLLPQSAGEIGPPTKAAPPLLPKQLLPVAAAATEATAAAAAPKLDLDRRFTKERERRRFLGSLVVWGVCTLLLCLVLWLLVFSSR